MAVSEAEKSWDALVPVGGRRVTSTVFHHNIVASEVAIEVDDTYAWARIAPSVSIHAFGSNREQQLHMLASIGDAIREQAKDALAALRAAEVDE